MEKITNISKGLTSQETNTVPAVPSLAGKTIKIDFKPIPTLHNFVKSPSVTSIESRTAGKYQLTRYSHGGKGASDVRVVLSYKLGRTKYKITSYRKVKAEGKAGGNEGNIQITKNYFQTKEFKLVDLPKEVVDSVNSNIELFNGAYAIKLGEMELKRIEEEEKQSKGFFEGLDL